MSKNIKTTKETDTGRNTNFVNKSTGENMTRSQFVKQIEQGQHPDYHVREINGVKTPCSNPDGKSGNNLG